MQYYDIVTSPRWQTAANMKIVMLAYPGDKLSDYDRIWYTESDSDCDKNDLTKMQILRARWRTNAILKNVVLVITRQRIVQFLQNFCKKNERYECHDGCICKFSKCSYP